MTDPIRFLRQEVVLDRIGLGRTKLYEMVRDKVFPQPVRQGRTLHWVESEVIEWQRERMAERGTAVHA